MSNNPRVAEIEEMRESFRKRAEEAHEKGESDLYSILQYLVHFLDSDKLLIAPRNLLDAYHNMLKNAQIEVDRLKLPVLPLISSTSNEAASGSEEKERIVIWFTEMNEFIKFVKNAFEGEDPKEHERTCLFPSRRARQM